MKNRQLELQILQIDDKINRLNIQRNFIQSLLEERSDFNGKKPSDRTDRS
jgi:hypothetical protein